MIIYPLSKIYSDNLKHPYPVSGVGGGGPTPTPGTNDYLYFSNPNQVSITIYITPDGSTPTYHPDLESSYDTTTWSHVDIQNSPQFPLQPGEKIYLRGSNQSYQFNIESGNTYRIKELNAQPFESGGNIMSLFDPNPDVFNNLHHVGKHGFCNMFYGSSIITPPDMSKIFTTDDSAFWSMFRNSTLTNTPDLSGLTIIKTGALQHMCRSTQIAQGIDLKNASMNSGVTNALDNLYNGCTNLISAYAPKNLQGTSFSNWLSGVYSSGTVYIHTGESLTTGASGVPNGWTTQYYN